jgi:hypothetical protein
MKNIIASAVLLFAFFHAGSQGIIANLNSGIASGYSLDAYHDTSTFYSAAIKRGTKFGMNVGYKIDRFFSVDLSLQYQPTDISVALHHNGNDLVQVSPVDLLWVQAGGTSYLPAGHFEFLIGSYLGMGFYHFRDFPVLNKSSSIRFAWSVKGGMGYYITKNLGINFAVDGLFSTDPLKKRFATPGLSNGETGFSYFFQLSFSGGIIIKLFSEKEKSK